MDKRPAMTGTETTDEPAIWPSGIAKLADGILEVTTDAVAVLKGAT